MNDVSTSQTASLRPHRDERLALYTVVAIAAVVLGVIDGGLRLMLIGTPFAVTVLIRARRQPVHHVAVRATLTHDRCIEGDEVEGVIEINTPAELAAEVMIERLSDDVGPVDERPWAWAVPAGAARPVGLPFTVLAERWSRNCPGQVAVRLVDHESMWHWTAPPVPLPDLTVLPHGRRLDALMRIDRAPAASGAHPTSTAWTGGYDFAEVRDYRPGDRLRDLNWSASLRRDQPAVNHRLPERSGEIIIVVDTFPDALRRHSAVARDLIAVAGRLTWTVARAHLAANDRVGIVVAGSRPVWLAPRSGRRAQYAIFTALLHASASSADDVRSGFVREAPHISPGAAIIAVSPLARRPTIEQLLMWRNRGHRVEVVALDVETALARHAASLPDEIRRVRGVAFRERVASLRRHGVPVVATSARADSAATARSLARLQRRAVALR